MNRSFELSLRRAEVLANALESYIEEQATAFANTKPNSVEAAVINEELQDAHRLLNLMKQRLNEEVVA